MKASQLAREKSAQVWCREETSRIVMDTTLAEAFAEVLEEVWSQPWLGNATTGELLEEIKSRVNLSYKTTAVD